jgi:hypothetical protein
MANRSTTFVDHDIEWRSSQSLSVEESLSPKSIELLNGSNDGFEIVQFTYCNHFIRPR